MANTHSIDLEKDSSQYLSVADSASLSITGDISIEFWFKPESQPADGVYYHLISKWLETGNQRSYLVQYYNATGGGDVYKLDFVVSSTGTNTAAATKTLTLPISEWTRVAIVWTASTSTADFFINGSSIGTATTGALTAIFDSTATFNIGAMGGGGNYSDGKFDDVRVWNDKRTSAEISNNYNTELVGDEANLQGYWKLNNSLLDETTNNNDLTNNNSAVFTTDIPSGGSLAILYNLVSYWKLDEASGNAADSHGSNTLVNQNTMAYAAGKINNAANPASSGNKFLKIANASQTGLDITGDITVSLWVKTSENSKYVLFFTDGATAVGYGLAMGTAASKPLGQIAVFVGQSWFTTTSSARIDDNAWHHVVFTMSGTSVALYLDGSADGTGTATTGLSHTGDRTIGDNHTTNTLNALVDEVGVWNRALSADEITSLYNGGAGFQYPFVQDLSINVSDALTITESVILTLANNINVSDALTITESVTLSNPELGGINVSDALTITESVTLSNPELGGINVSDALTITESVTLTLANNINVSDALTITEINTLELISYINIVETILIIEESIVQNNQLGSININEILSITENLTLINFSNINVSDTISITENTTISNSQLGDININDILSITENLTLINFSNINVSDTILITENTTIQNSQLGDINLNEALLITENYTLTNSQLGDINVNETPTITESITMFETEEGGNPNISDTLSISESITVLIPNLGDISKNETLTISESVTTFETEEGGNPDVSDALTISESITLENFRFSPSGGMKPIGIIGTIV